MKKLFEESDAVRLATTQQESRQQNHCPPVEW
jgi:hypothetical protein